MTSTLPVFSTLELIALGIFALASLCLAWQDIRSFELDIRYEGLALIGALFSFFLHASKERLCQLGLNLSFWLIALILTVFYEERRQRTVLGGADFRYLLLLALMLRFESYVLLLPVACLLALPHALTLLIKRSLGRAIPLIPYLLFSVILLIISGRIESIV